jgi:DNA-binding GntR family transcriptional regulator
MAMPLALTAYNLIKKDIVRGSLAPGQQITERELQESYGVGRTPVREALGRLADQGLIRILHRKGYLVAPIDLRDVHHAYSLRLLLESEAVRLAAGQVDAAQLRRLDEICKAGYDPTSPDSVSDFLQVNTEFHVRIARASGNERLANVLAPLLEEMERLLHVGLRLSNRTMEMAHQHADLVEALLAGDSDKSSRIAAAQIRASEAMVMSALLRGASPASDDRLPSFIDAGQHR